MSNSLSHAVIRMQLISIKCRIFHYIIVQNINFTCLSHTGNNIPVMPFLR